MKEISIFFTTLFAILILVNYYNKNKDLIILEGIDNRKYRLLDLQGKEECLNILVQLNKNISKLFILLKEEIKKDKIEGIDIEEIKTLIKNYNPDNLNENLENRSLTAYSLNKGEEICLCLREPHNELLIIKDINTLMFVLIHELSHLMTTEYGHTKQFWKNMVYLLKKSSEAKVYNLVDYNKYPVKYCGINVNKTPLFF